MKKRFLAVLLGIAMVGSILGGCTQTKETQENTTKANSSEGSTGQDETGEVVSLTVGYPTSFNPEAFKGVAELAKQKLNIDIVLQPFSDADETALRSLLASGEMPDMLLYNSGSLLKRINPSQYFMDLSSNESLMNRLDDTFKNAVTVDGAIYGVPQASSMAGGVLYNKVIYDKYNLEVPKTWSDFLANCEVLKNAGETAVIGSFGTSWTSQVVFLADYYNITAEVPDFSQQFEAGKLKYESTPIAVRSFEKYEDMIPYYNEDSAVATYEDACAMLADGTGAHYFMLTQALSNINSLYGEEVTNNIGFFAVPGDNAQSNGMTVWPSNGIYVNKDSSKTEAIMRFLEFYISDEGLNKYSLLQAPTGPFHVVGYTPNEKGYKAVKEDMQAYFDAGNTALAQEYETSVKGSGAESICVEVATGQVSGKEAAKKYDIDCYKQAIQLGLNWDK